MIIRRPLTALLLFATTLSGPALACRPFGSYVFAEDSKGGIWFTEGDNNAISRLAPDGTVRAHILPTPTAEPSWVALDRKENVWFVEAYASKIGRLGRDGRIVEYPSTGGHLIMVKADSKGEAWFTQMAGLHTTGEHAAHAPQRVSKVGRITAKGKMIDYKIDEGWPTSIAIDNADRVWVTVLVPGTEPTGKLVRLDRKGRWTFVQRWENSCPNSLVAAAGKLWLADRCRGVLARVESDGRLTETRIAPNTSIQQMSLAPDGVLWFTVAEGGRIGRMTPAGKIEYIERPENGDEAFAILATRSGDVVYSEFYNYNVNRYTREGVFEEHLIDVDHRRGAREAREGEACYVTFASHIASKAEMDRKRAAELADGKLKPSPDGADKLAATKCLECHDARRLLLSRRSDWSPSIERMQEYMDVRNIPRLTDDEKRILVRYFNTQFGLSAGLATTKVPKN